VTTVSVIIPVLNRAAIVGRAIMSALSQQLPSAGWSTNVVVVDDGSSDDLATTLEPFGERVLLVRHAHNRGAAAARNTGIAASDGDLIAFLDSDDLWLPGKLKTQIDFMLRYRYPASCTAFLLGRSGLPEIASPAFETGPLGLAELAWGCFVSPGSTLIFERSVFDEIGPLDTALQRLEDWDWLLRYTQRHTLGFFAQPLARIEASSYNQLNESLEALAQLRRKHIGQMAGSVRRHFAAALDLERAAAHWRQGDIVAASWPFFKSVIRSPVRHAGVAALLHNRLASG